MSKTAAIVFFMAMLTPSCDKQVDEPNMEEGTAGGDIPCNSNGEFFWTKNNEF